VTKRKGKETNGFFFSHLGNTQCKVTARKCIQRKRNTSCYVI